MGGELSSAERPRELAERGFSAGTVRALAVFGSSSGQSSILDHRLLCVKGEPLSAARRLTPEQLPALDRR